MEEELPKTDTLVKNTFELTPPTKEEKIEEYEKLKSVLEKYDIGEIVSDILNLEWKEKVIVSDTDSEYGADYKIPNKAYVNYSHGAWETMGIAHEMVHLIMYQNGWTENPKIAEYIEKHEDLQDKTRMRTVGYPIEQMVAYLLMRDVGIKISEKDSEINREKVLSQYNKDWFTKILDKEYPTKHLKKLGKKIIDKWDERPKNISIINWIESILEFPG
jgi:hypothetical protein